MRNRTTTAALPTINIPNFFNMLADQAIDTINTAANICRLRARMAPSGSRSATLWMNRERVLEQHAASRGFTLNAGAYGCGVHVWDRVA